ncbi:oligosaccharide repeat unit polymerase [Evansella sp. LMS18]|uniref:O-antigen polymerase n=1 Tax=Evansella sp. LMS18 TaxID=2924033 RepID=UPI0020D0FFA9|nr:O-antigen polymerase [Evansella sp. LMS18]UTR12122.1 oligosaccharide repeat unit polymerase [Evansella sp. LMS18]
MDNLKVKNSLAGILKIYLIVLSLIIFSVFVILNSNFTNINLLSIFMFLFIGVFSLGNIVTEIIKRSFSLQLMHWVFCFIFFFIAGFTQYINNQHVYSLQIEPSTLNYVLLIIIIWMLSFYCGTVVVIKKQNSGYKALTSLLNTKIKHNKYTIFLLMIVSLIITLYILIAGGFSALFSRSTAGEVFQGETAGESSFTTYFFGNMVVYSTALTVLYYKKLKGNFKYLLFIQIAFLLIVNPIFGMARFNVAIVYLGMLILIFDNLRYNKKFIITFLTGFIFVFPVLDLFRHESFETLNLEEVIEVFRNLPEVFLSGHYDAFSMVVNTVRHVTEYGVSLGYQFLGPLLFYVPRSIWADKPLGSGYTVREAQGATFLNVSSPLVAEAYINFALIGVILVGFLIGKVTFVLDKTYWENVKMGTSAETYLAIIYPFLISIFFFMNRGDLLSTTSFAVSHIAVFTMLFCFNNVIYSILHKKSNP